MARSVRCERSRRTVVHVRRASSYGMFRYINAARQATPALVRLFRPWQPITPVDLPQRPTPARRGARPKPQFQSSVGSPKPLALVLSANGKTMSVTNKALFVVERNLRRDLTLD